MSSSDNAEKQAPEGEVESAEPEAEAVQEPAEKPKKHHHRRGICTPVTEAIDKVIGACRVLEKDPAGFAGYQKLLGLLGSYALLGAGVIFFLTYFVMAFKTKSVSMFLTGIGGIVVFLALHYVAARFVSACPKVLKRDPGRVSSKALMDCLALLALVGAVGALATGISTAVAVKSFQPVWPALIAFFVMLHLTVLCANPKACLNIEKAGKGTPGEKALAIITLVPRLALAVAPVLVGYGLVAATVWMFVAMIKCWVNNTILPFQIATAVTVEIALAPLAAYLAYLAVALIAELCASVLRIAPKAEE